MPRRPTDAELKVINKKFNTGEPFDTEDIWVVEYESARSNVRTAYFSYLTPGSIKNFAKDVSRKEKGAGKAVPFYVNHDVRSRLPLGVNFGGSVDGSGEDVGFRHLAFFRSGYSSGDITADDYVKAVSMSAMQETSVGFTANKFTCRICKNDIRTSSCGHWPGARYNVGTPDEPKYEVCTYDVDGAHLEEVSAAWKAALPGARVLSDDRSGSAVAGPFQGDLNIKQFPVGSTLYFPCDGSGIRLVDPGEEGEDMIKQELEAQLAAVADEATEEVVEVTEQLTEAAAGTEAITDEEAQPNAYAEQIASLEGELSAAKAELAGVQEKLAEVQAEAAMSKTLVDKWISEVKAAVHHAAVALDAETYNKETLDKMLNVLSVDELLQYRKDVAKRLSKVVKTGRFASDEGAATPRALADFQDPNTFRVGR